MSDQESLGRKVLVFGPQVLSFNQEWFDKLRADVAKSFISDWVPQVIAELPEHFSSLCDAFPKLRVVEGTRWLQGLQQGLESGSFEDITTGGGSLRHVPNIVLTPLCVLLQLAAYTSYLKSSLAQTVESRDLGAHTLHPLRDTETAGFCTGILAALAVSLSTNDTELQEYGGTVIRLAMLIGAMVDAQDAEVGDSTSLSALWRTSSGLQDLEVILQGHEDVSQYLPRIHHA